ncbi:MAG: YicC family protein [Bacteroidaceae bacterium]|nr:YicC family protein [Bacteroidaceae bacterium]
MIQSMTGYGKADVTYNGKKIHVEIKSLNSKALDLSTRIAPLYREKEMELRKLIQENLERGKVDFNLWIEKDTTAVGGVINADAVANYVAQMNQISAERLGGVGCLTENIWETLVRLPEVVQTSAVETLEPEEWQVVSEIVNEAIAHLVDFRKQEGEALYAKFCKNLDTIEGLMKQLEPFEVSRVEKIRQRLTERLAELKGVDYDKCRLEQELIYYIEKLDINEEKQRLANHLEYFKQTMLNGSGQGKKLGFIAQEMGREINTTGSKSNQAEMQNIVVMMKDELEQIKEQVLNVM